jgi:hypothetical protein
MTSQGTAHGRFRRAIARRNLLNAETAAREMGGLSLADAALRWLQRWIDERLPALAEVALATAALAELRHGRRGAGVDTLRKLLSR